jgi:hypothetical protein
LDLSLKPRRETGIHRITLVVVGRRRRKKQKEAMGRKGRKGRKGGVGGVGGVRAETFVSRGDEGCMYTVRTTY